MLDHDQLIPAEREDQLLINDLNSYFDTRAEDSASLASIRARLLQKTATALPVADDTRGSQVPLPLPTRHERQTGMKPIRTFARQRLRHPYLNTLAAAVLVVLLIGSFALTLHVRQGATTGSPAIAHGWSVLATFSGTGNKTIEGLDIEVGHKYGEHINCTNTSSGWVSVAIDGSNSGGAACGANTSGPLAPEGSVTSPNMLPPVLTVQVTADASTSWTLMLFKGTYYPPLNIDTTNWRAMHNEMDGTGNGTVLMDVTLPTTWEIQFVCYGSGNFEIGLSSNIQSTTPDITENKGVQCNGQLNGDQFDSGYLQGTIVHQIKITTGPENDWQVVLLGCTNSLPSCGTGTVTPTSTP